MESIVYLLFPTAIVFKLFIKKNDKVVDLIIKYMSVCCINNILCSIIISFYFPQIESFDSTINFFLKYSLLGIIVGVIMGLFYKIFTNYIEVKLEVTHEKNSKKTK